MAVIPKKLGLLIFPQFETLDVYGPIGLIATRVVNEYYNVTLISGTSSNPSTPLLSTCQIPTLAEITIDTALTQDWDVILLPGGIGFEQLVTDTVFLEKLIQLNEKCEIMFTVCTGSFTLAATGLLDGVQATSNKALYCEWTKKFPLVSWVHKARWVHDGKYLSSSGISAGMDAALYLMSVQFGVGEARGAARACEYIWNEDPSFDPFMTPCEDE